jgi:hypothetical protein
MAQEPLSTYKCHQVINFRIELGECGIILKFTLLQSAVRSFLFDQHSIIRLLVNSFDHCPNP